MLISLGNVFEFLGDSPGTHLASFGDTVLPCPFNPLTPECSTKMPGNVRLAEGCVGIFWLQLELGNLLSASLWG